MQPTKRKDAKTELVATNSIKTLIKSDYPMQKGNRVNQPTKLLENVRTRVRGEDTVLFAPSVPSCSYGRPHSPRRLFFSFTFHSFALASAFLSECFRASAKRCPGFNSITTRSGHEVPSRKSKRTRGNHSPPPPLTPRHFFFTSRAETVASSTTNASTVLAASYA